MPRPALLLVLLVAGCQGGAGWLDGAGFQVADAVFERRTVFETAKPVTMILVSDAGDLCDRITSGRSLAGHSELSIESWQSGSVRFELRSYADDCEVETTEIASQGWVEAQDGDPYRASFDVVFRTESRNVSGSLSADFCPLPSDARIGCN